MSAWIIREADSPAAWDAAVDASAFGHVLQRSAWAGFRRAQGWSAQRLVVQSGSISGRGAQLRPSDAASDLQGPADLDFAGMQVLQRRSPFGSAAYVPRGPVCSPDHPALPALLEAAAARLPGCVFVRIEPHWEQSQPVEDRLRSMGLCQVAAVQPRSTLRLDLEQGPDALLAAMKQKWRYNVRLASRRDLILRREGPESFAAFDRLVRETAIRQGAGARPEGYYAAAAAAFGDASRLYVARFEENILAAILVLHQGREATYLYGGSSLHERRRMPNHGLQWLAIQEACEAGMRCYDFWGIPDAIGAAQYAGEPIDAVPAEQDGLWGVWGFKRGFGGQVWRSVGAWDLVRSPLRYALIERGLPGLRRLRSLLASAGRGWR